MMMKKEITRTILVSNCGLETAVTKMAANVSRGQLRRESIADTFGPSCGDSCLVRTTRSTPGTVESQNLERFIFSQSEVWQR